MKFILHPPDSNDSVQPLQPYWEEVWLEATPGDYFNIIYFPIIHNFSLTLLTFVCIRLLYLVLLISYMTIFFSFVDFLMILI